MSPWEVPGWAKDTAGDALKNARAIRGRLANLYKPDGKESFKHEKTAERLRQEIYERCEKILSIVANLSEEDFKQVIAGIIQKEALRGSPKRKESRRFARSWQPEYPPNRTYFVTDVLQIVGIKFRVLENFFTGNPNFEVKEGEIAED